MRGRDRCRCGSALALHGCGFRKERTCVSTPRSRCCAMTHASAAAMIGLALWPGRRASQLICLLAAAYFAWVGIVFFGVIDSGMTLWAAVFILEAILLLVAGIMRRDLVFAPRSSLSSVLGTVFIFYALVAYPIIGVLGGHPLQRLQSELRRELISTKRASMVDRRTPRRCGGSPLKGSAWRPRWSPPSSCTWSSSSTRSSTRR